MTLEHLDNLVKIQKLKKETADQNEFNGMLNSAGMATVQIIAIWFFSVSNIPSAWRMQNGEY